MKLNNANTQLGVTFRVVEFDEKDILNLVQQPTYLTRITDAVNADRRQKIALVDARYDLSEKIGTLGFARKTKQIVKDGNTITVPDETEAAYIKRFIDALVTGAHTTDGFSLPSGDEKVKETAALAFLQSIANTLGDKTHEGQPAYELNLEKTVRAAGGGGLIPKWATEAATAIITNKNTAKWEANFTNGYTTNRGIAITPITFGSFTQKAEKVSTVEQKEAVHASNIRNLAKAIVEVRRQENEQLQPEFA